MAKVIIIIIIIIIIIKLIIKNLKIRYLPVR